MLLLTGCPVPTIIHADAKTLNRSPLPHPIDSQKALVYIVQPTYILDLYMVGGMASEGFKYVGSDVYVQSSSKKASTHYLGNIHSYNMLCFYADPGSYHLKFYNKGGLPENIERAVRLNANQVYFYGLSNKNVTLSTYSDVRFNILTENEGKNYLGWYRKNQRLPQKCANISEVPERPSKDYFVLKIINESDVSYRIGLYQGAAKDQVNVAPKQSYQYKQAVTFPSVLLTFANQNNQKNTILGVALNSDITHLSLWYVDTNWWVPAVRPQASAHHVVTEGHCVRSLQGIDRYIICTAVIQNSDTGAAEAIF